MKITLKQLRYFEALAKEQHFGRAAALCNVSQPALSMQIGDLEAAIGGALVERGRGGVFLTELGAEALRRARRILAEARDLEALNEIGDDPLAGRLRLGAIPTVAPYLFPSLLRGLADAAPKLELRLRETQTMQLTTELEEGLLDVIVVAAPFHRDGLVSRRLFEDRFLLAEHADRATASTPLTPEAVDVERLLLLEEGHCLRDQALSFCGAGEATLDTRGASSLGTLVQLVANGYGATLLPEISLDAELERTSAIALRRFERPEPSRRLVLAWRKTTSRKEIFDVLFDIVMAAAPDANAGASRRRAAPG